MPTFNTEVDYYAILQVHPDAHLEVIKRAYRTIVGLLQSHPDLGGSHEQAVQVNEAYAVLSDPVTRKAYDEARQQRGAARMAPPPPSAAPSPPPRPGAAKSPVAPSPKVATEATQKVRCQWCGARNRLPVHADPSQAYCGKCRSLLAGLHRTAYAMREIRLSAQLTEQLEVHGEIFLKRAHAPSDGHLQCLRCQTRWKHQAGERLPERCPRCHSAAWSDFRLFRCRHCRGKFSSADLVSWPYALFPECPACRRKNWHAGCEKHPLRWMLNKVLRG